MVPAEYVDFLLIRDLYHCTPSELDQQDEYITSLHIDFMNIKAEEGKLNAKRAEQRAKLKRLGKKI